MRRNPDIGTSQKTVRGFAPDILNLEIHLFYHKWSNDDRRRAIAKREDGVPVCDCGIIAVDIVDVNNPRTKNAKRFICANDNKCFFNEWYYHLDGQWKKYHAMNREEVHQVVLLQLHPR